MRSSQLILLFILSFVSLVSFSKDEKLDYQVTELTNQLSSPWSMAFLSAQRFLITERTGSLRIFDKNGLSEAIPGLPSDIYVKGQGGLLDVVLHPDYQSNAWLYLTYASGEASENALTLVRAKLVDNQLTSLQTLFRVSPTKSTPVHYAGRIAFLPDNTLLLTSGDGFDYREDAQRLDNQMGKVIRLHDDGSLPSDNPFSRQSEKPLAKAVYSYGHRNPQAILYDPTRDLIFSHEHGPAGGDEVNIIQSGNNYGWPVITNGRDYSGASITPFREYEGMQQPFIDWSPSIAPSGMALYQGNEFPQLQGDLLVSTLKTKEVRWIQLEGTQVTSQTSLFKQLGQRIRDVKVSTTGVIYLLTDAGQLLKVTRK